jgi:hypothetical protein
MGEQDKEQAQTGREIFDATDSGAEDRPFIPKLRSDTLPKRVPRTLEEFRSVMLGVLRASSESYLDRSVIVEHSPCSV